MLPAPVQQTMQQGKPCPGTGGAAVAMGAVMGGAAGAGAMGGMYAGQQQQAYSPQPQTMGASSGFMATASPFGQSWSQYCTQEAPQTDQYNVLSGRWGECLAWAKVFEKRNPNWSSDPDYRSGGPSFQVIQAMLSQSAMGNQRQLQEAANTLEAMCASAISSGQPLPVINQCA
mmetsp:Transcript_51401/g.99347  ORF Transcript_51401/g.99347 Transcript_51401/m.99347 type:complete len:173 (+) Transcript_51401:2-520(+)